jgi:hypothetical protein
MFPINGPIDAGRLFMKAGDGHPGKRERILLIRMLSRRADTAPAFFVISD